MRVTRAAITGLIVALAPLPQGARGSEPPPEIVVYAAISLRDALEEMSPACERAVGVRLVFNFGASNDLARQIVAAGKADIFLSADEAWMDRVAEAGLVDAPARRTLLSNRLVVVGPAGTSISVASAADLARAPARFISLADPQSVPAGKYAREWLEGRGQWEAVRRRVLPAVDARAALAAVEAGAAELGVVYATDAALSRRVRVLHVVPVTEGPRIRYSVASLRDRPQTDLSRAVISWMAGPDARRVFERFGFHSD